MPLPSLEVKFDGTPMLAYDKKSIRALMRKAGSEIASVARALIRRNTGGGVLYRGSGGSKYRPYKKGSYRASAPGQPPVSVTGMLAQSIVVRPFQSGEGVAIRDRMFYALFLEQGAKGGGRKAGAKGKAGTVTGRILQPRPFLTQALADREASIETRLKAAILDGIEFKRQKA